LLGTSNFSTFYGRKEGHGINELPFIRFVGCVYFTKVVLHFVPITCLVIVLNMKNQPELKAWIGSANVNAFAFAQRDSLFIERMLISIKDSPHPIIFLERIPALS